MWDLERKEEIVSGKLRLKKYTVPKFPESQGFGSADSRLSPPFLHNITPLNPPDNYPAAVASISTINVGIARRVTPIRLMGGLAFRGPKREPGTSKCLRVSSTSVV